MFINQPITGAVRSTKSITFTENGQTVATASGIDALTAEFAQAVIEQSSLTGTVTVLGSIRCELTVVIPEPSSLVVVAMAGVAAVLFRNAKQTRKNC